MTKAEMKRQAEIERLSTLVEEKAQTRRGGSACLVPSSDGLRKYRVDVDENYCTTACECQGGQRDCKHKQAVRLYFVSKIRALRNDKLNPVYQFLRAGKLVTARLSQFSAAERAALREQERMEEEARRRAEYNVIFDPNYLSA